MVPPGGFGSFGSHYPQSVAVPSSVPPPVPLQQSQSHQQQQQTIVITENPNMRKIRSASTENTMPEGNFFSDWIFRHWITHSVRWDFLPSWLVGFVDCLDLSIKLEVGREDELGIVGLSGKQRSFSMDLSPSEPPFGSMGGSGGPPSNIWPLPSPSSISAQHAQSHDLNHTQTTADGKEES